MPGTFLLLFVLNLLSLFTTHLLILPTDIKMLISSLFTLITSLALASTAAAQQTISAEDGSTYTCPDVLTVEVAYVSYCQYIPFRIL